MTLRELTFDKTLGPMRFSVIYTAFATPPAQNQMAAKGIDVLRREAALAKKLDAISDQKADGRALKASGSMMLQLEQHEIELLRERIDKMVGWLAAKAPDVVDAYDWLGTGTELKGKAPK